MKGVRKRSRSPSPHESMALGQGSRRSAGIGAYRLEGEAPVRFSQHSGARRYPDVVFAFHDRDEIGPKMLARLAKHRGLAPEDL
jgi:hypothetical protein